MTGMQHNFGRKTKESWPIILLLRQLFVPLHRFFESMLFETGLRRDGRVVDYTGLENRRAERHRGFESLSLRNIT